MRSTTLVLGAVLLVGCAERGTSFDMLSVLPGDTHGVALEGERARVGMAGQICDVDARTASVGADLDAADGQERVLDARGDLVVGELDGRLFLDDGAATLFDVQVLDAGITPAGEPVSVLRGANGRCDVAFGSTAYTLEGLSCAVAPGFAVAPGAVWLADGRSVARVDADGTVDAWAVEADRVVWDGERAIVARSGAPTVQAFEADGTRAWELELHAPVHDLAPAGPGSVAAMLDEGEAGGALVMLDGAGAHLGTFELPGVTAVGFDPAGTTLSLQTPDGVLFYSVRGGAPLGTEGLTYDGTDGALVGVQTGVGVLGTIVLATLVVD